MTGGKLGNGKKSRVFLLLTLTVVWAKSLTDTKPSAKLLPQATDAVRAYRDIKKQATEA